MGPCSISKTSVQSCSVYKCKYRYKFKEMTTSASEWTHTHTSCTQLSSWKGGGHCVVEVNGLTINPAEPLSFSLYYTPCYVRLAQCSLQNNSVPSSTTAHLPRHDEETFSASRYHKAQWNGPSGLFCFGIILKR
jgi:hypothetical protein